MAEGSANSLSQHSYFGSNRACRLLGSGGAWSLLVSNMAPKRKSVSEAGIVSENGDGFRARIFMNRTYTSGPTRPTRELAHADLNAARAGATSLGDVAAVLKKQFSSSSMVPRAAAVLPEPAAEQTAVAGATADEDDDDLKGFDRDDALISDDGDWPEYVNESDCR